MQSLSFLDYRHAVSRAVVALDVTAPEQDRFQGAIDATAAGDIHVFAIDADGHGVHRTPSLISRAPQQYFKFSRIERGSGMIVQDGRETALGSGDMALYDTDRPYSLLFDDAVQMSVVMFPKVLLDIPTEDTGRITATRLNAGGALGAMVGPYLGSLAEGAHHLDSRIARRMLRTAVDMLSTVLEANLVATDGPVSAHSTTLTHILTYIDVHLADSELSPSQIAAAHYISVRHLHSMFSEQGASVSTVIRRRRLQRCYDALTDPYQAHRSIAEIAMSAGFVDAAHFSRVFRAQYGVPPRAVRAG